MLKAFLDDSGTNGDDGVVVVAGFVGSERLWRNFEERWRKFLTDFEIRRFHVANYLSRNRPFESWTDDRFDRARKEICKIFYYSPPFGIGCGVRIGAFDDWRHTIEYPVHPDSYYFCLERCLRALIHGIAEVPEDEGMQIFIDEDKGREKMGIALSQWQQGRLRRSGDVMIDKERKIETLYASSFQVLPLQAADILAHGAFQEMRSRINGAWPSSEQVFLKYMKENNVAISINSFYDREAFDVAFGNKM